MSIIRLSAHALRKLSLRSKKGSRGITHLSQPVYKVEQGVERTQSKSTGWAIPATLAIVGLGFSTFSTHQLVSGNDSIKMLSSLTANKN